MKSQKSLGCWEAPVSLFPHPVSRHFLGAKFWAHRGWRARSPCLWGQPPPSPNPRPHTRGSRAALRNTTVPGPRPRAGSATTRQPPRPRRAPCASGLAFSRCQEQAPDSYREGAAGDCPCCAQRPPGLPRRPCLFTRKGAWDRAAPGPPGEGRCSAAVAAPRATAPPCGARGEDSALACRERQEGRPRGDSALCQLPFVLAALGTEPSPVPVPDRTFHTHTETGSDSSVSTLLLTRETGSK